MQYLTLVAKHPAYNLSTLASLSGVNHVILYVIVAKTQTTFDCLAGGRGALAHGYKKSGHVYRPPPPLPGASVSV